MTNWKENDNFTFRKFTEELTKEWINAGFSKKETGEWLGNGLQPSDAEFAEWLRDTKRFGAEQFFHFDDQLFREEYTKNLEIQKGISDWKSISPDFTPELLVEWESKGFSYEECKEWIDAGLFLSETDFCAWLRDKKGTDISGVLDGKFGTLEQLEEEYNFELSKTKETDRQFCSKETIIDDENQVDTHQEFTEELQQKWKEKGFSCEEAKQWLEVGFKPDQATWAEEWKKDNFALLQVKEWINMGLKAEDGRYASWLRDKRGINNAELLKNSEDKGEFKKEYTDWWTRRVFSIRSWMEFDSDFIAKKPLDEKESWQKTWQQAWQVEGVSNYSEVWGWIVADFKAKELTEVSKWRVFIRKWKYNGVLIPYEVKQWLDAGLKKNEYELADYCYRMNYSFSVVKDNLEKIRSEYQVWLRNLKSANEWLNKNYPKEEVYQRKDDQINQGRRREKIERLNISNQNLVGNLDLADFFSLRELDISNNQITSLNLSNLGKLERIFCQNNKLVTLNLVNCPKISEINCFSNWLTKLDFLTSLDNKKLKSLNISNNNIGSDFSASDLTPFSRFVNLEELYLGANEFYGSLRHFKNCTNLKRIAIFNTDIDRGLEYLPESLELISCRSLSEDKCKALEKVLGTSYKENYKTWRKVNAQLLANSRSWTNIHPDFDKLHYGKTHQERWEKLGFSYSETKEWININWKIEEAGFANHLKKTGYNPKQLPVGRGLRRLREEHAIASDDWRNLHEGFDGRSKRWREDPGSKEVGGWIKFEPSLLTEERARKWKKLGLDYYQVKQWIKSGLEADEFNIAAYSKWKGYNHLSADLTSLKNEYRQIHNYLDFHYPKEIRKAITELDISNKILEGHLTLRDFVNLEYLDCSHNNQLTSVNLLGLKQLKLKWLGVTYEEASSRLESAPQERVQIWVDKSKEDTKSLKSDLKIDQKLLDAQEWLDNNYLREIRKNVTELDISSYKNLCKEYGNSLNTEEKKTLLNDGEQLTGKLDLKGFTNLEKLSCWGNQLINLDVSDCKKMKELRCDDNKLTSLNLVNCKKSLEILSCFDNPITKLDLSNFQKLRVLNLDKYFETKSIPIHVNFSSLLIELDLSNCKNLKELYCGRNKLVDLNLDNCQNLEKLDCHNNQLVDTRFLTDLPNKGKLTELDISNNNFFPQDLSFLREFINLEKISLFDNPFYGSLEQLKEMNKLKKLFIRNTDIDEGLECLPINLEEFTFTKNVRGKVKAIEEKLRPFSFDFHFWRLHQPFYQRKLKKEQLIEIIEKRIQEIKEEIEDIKYGGGKHYGYFDFYYSKTRDKEKNREKYEAMLKEMEVRIEMLKELKEQIVARKELQLSDISQETEELTNLLRIQSEKIKGLEEELEREKSKFKENQSIVPFTQEEVTKKKEERIAFLENTITDLKKLVTKQQRKIIDAYLSLSPEKQLLKELINVHLNFSRAKIHKIPAKDLYNLRKERDKIREELENRIENEELSTEVDLILDECHELARLEGSLEENVSERLLIEISYQQLSGGPVVITVKEGSVSENQNESLVTQLIEHLKKKQTLTEPEKEIINQITEFLGAKIIFLNTRQITIKGLQNCYNKLKGNKKYTKADEVGNIISAAGGVANSLTFGVPKAFGEAVVAINNSFKRKFSDKRTEEFKELLINDKNDLSILEDIIINDKILKDKGGETKLFINKYRIFEIDHSVWEDKPFSTPEEMDTVIILLNKNLEELRIELDQEEKRFKEFLNDRKQIQQQTQIEILPKSSIK